jgi:molecular chaperone Hsp31 and glyoxalase 3
MPWFVGDLLTAKGVQILNTDVTGATHVDRELITGDSPQAANAVGKLCAQAVLDKYTQQ